jgi:hypothetical protein
MKIYLGYAKTYRDKIYPKPPWDVDEEVVENRNAGFAHQRWPFGFASPGFGKKIPVLGG